MLVRRRIPATVNNSTHKHDNVHAFQLMMNQADAVQNCCAFGKASREDLCESAAVARPIRKTMGNCVC